MKKDRYLTMLNILEFFQLKIFIDEYNVVLNLIPLQWKSVNYDIFPFLSDYFWMGFNYEINNFGCFITTSFKANNVVSIFLFSANQPKVESIILFESSYLFLIFLFAPIMGGYHAELLGFSIGQS
jgi:hypothetical protein